MRLDFFMLADHAEAEQASGGARKLNIRGGAVTHVQAPTFPYTLASIALVMRFFLESDDEGTTHTFEIRVEHPDGTRVITLTHEVDIRDLPGRDHPDEEPRCSWWPVEERQVRSPRSVHVRSRARRDGYRLEGDRSDRRAFSRRACSRRINGPLAPPLVSASPGWPTSCLCAIAPTRGPCERV